jgi:hypothetical protein
MDFLYSIFGLIVFLLIAYLCYRVILEKVSKTIIINNSTTTADSPGYDFAVHDVSHNRLYTKSVKKDNGPYIPLENGDLPYVTAPINNVDDYEYNLVFQNESEQDLSSTLRNKLTSQHPMDWAGQPPSSTAFQNGIREGFQTQTADPYSGLVDSTLTPPDTLAIEKAEREILQTYQPKHVGDLTTYDVDDAMTLIKKIYEKKGEIPTVIRNGNVYEIVGTQKKDEKIVYDETDSSAAANADPPMIDRPQAAADKNAALDPFFHIDDNNKEPSKQRWNYRQWTPGLERMFAPTETRENWY